MSFIRGMGIRIPSDNKDNDSESPNNRSNTENSNEFSVKYARRVRAEEEIIHHVTKGATLPTAIGAITVRITLFVILTGISALGA